MLLLFVAQTLIISRERRLHKTFFFFVKILCTPKLSVELVFVIKQMRKQGPPRVQDTLL